jgi:hypothetical protein
MQVMEDDDRNDKIFEADLKMFDALILERAGALGSWLV